MNTKTDLKKRLLRLFPVKILKEYFDEKGNSDDIIESVSAKSLNAIIDFAFKNASYTKQNVYLFELDKVFNKKSITSSFPFEFVKENTVSTKHSYFCLPEAEFSVYLSNPTDKTDLVFLQPVEIIIENKRLIIIYTKLEKNVHAYFPLAREAKRASVKNDEETTLKQIIAFFEMDYVVTPIDINKGIKHLWDIDDIDCHKIQWRNPHSISSETMDGMLTFKEKYPKEYLKIILTPISKSIWKYLPKDDYFCEGFSCDPSVGQISITKFPKLPNQVNHVITKILTNN